GIWNLECGVLLVDDRRSDASANIGLNRRSISPMIPQDLVLYEEEFQKIKQTLLRLHQDTSALLVFLVDKNGQQIAAVGDMNSLDTTALASLTAGHVAATDGLARLIGEKEFSILFHEGEKDNIHISIVARRVILVVIFDERASLGLVRLRV